MSRAQASNDAGNNAGSAPWPSWLTGVWERIDDVNRRKLLGPSDGPEINHRARTDNCMRLLRHNGLNLDQTIEAASYFPRGFGFLSRYPGGIGALINDLWAEQDSEQDKANKARKESAEAFARLYDPWADRAPPQWPGGVLSRDHEEIIATLCVRDGLDFGAQALTYIAAASGAAPKNARFAPYRHSGWSVPPVIWVMLIADSGQRKTALLNNAFTGLRRIHGERWRDYSQALEQWHVLSDADKKKTGKPREPHSLIVNDTSLEKLQMILAANERGTMLLKDELASLFDFGRYGTGNGATERSFYLEAYEGGGYTVHRIGRDSTYIPNCAMTIFGGTQPDRLASFKGLETDGLLQRFAVAILGPASPSRPDVAVRGKERMDLAIERLARMPGRDFGATEKGGQLIQQTERDATEFATITDYGPGFQGFARKLHGTHGRLALILHLLDGPGDSDIIPDTTIERAGQLARRYLLPHALHFYATVPGSAALALRDAAGWLLTKAKDRVLASDITSGVKSCRGMGIKQVTDLLDPLVTGGWMEPEEPFPGNRAWLLNPTLRTGFAERAKVEAERRERIRRLIGRIDA